MEVLRHDKFNLLILFGQAPIVAFLTYLVVDEESPRDFPYFVLALVSVLVWNIDISARNYSASAPSIIVNEWSTWDYFHTWARNSRCFQ